MKYSTGAHHCNPSGNREKSLMMAATVSGQIDSIHSRVRGLRQRRQLRKLLRFDDRTLADMGHSRTAILRALHRSRQAPAAYESSNIHLQNMHPVLPHVRH